MYTRGRIFVVHSFEVWLFSLPNIHERLNILPLALYRRTVRRLGESSHGGNFSTLFCHREDYFYARWLRHLYTVSPLFYHCAKYVFIYFMLYNMLNCWSVVVLCISMLVKFRVLNFLTFISIAIWKYVVVFSLSKIHRVHPLDICLPKVGKR